MAACVIGAVHLLAGPQFGLTLIVFFLSSSKVCIAYASAHAFSLHCMPMSGIRTGRQHAFLGSS